MQFLLSDLAAALNGQLVGPDLSTDGVSTDSRSVEAGQLFIPLIAERDGHDFVPGAVASGATAYVVSHAASPLATDPPAGSSAIVVADTGEALTAMGRLARSRLSGHVIGITGSVGKTSVKDLTRAASSVGGTAWASAASFNNEIGVPLTLANAPADIDRAIIEMGSRGIGHIAELCDIARPTVGLVTCVALAHSELFGSLEAVAIGKGELIEAVPADGIAVLNADDPMVAAMADRSAATVVRFGSETAPGQRPNVQYGSVTLDRLLRPSFQIESDWGSGPVSLQVRGAHMAQNAAAALAAALATGVAFDAAVAGIEAAALSPWRMDVAESKSGLVVVNDAYNANPTSMRAALHALLEVQAGTRIAVVGVMAELGEEGQEEHLAIAREATDHGVLVIAVDAPGYGDGVTHVADRDDAFDAVTHLVSESGSGTAVLVKGSRVAELELLADRLATL